MQASDRTKPSGHALRRAKTDASSDLSDAPRPSEQRIASDLANPIPLQINLNATAPVDDRCATVSPDDVRDAILVLVRQLHGVVTTRDAVFTALGQPEPASPHQTDNRSAS